MVVKHSGAFAANDCLVARQPPPMSWIEKEQIESGIKNSTGAVREQWKYRMAVWRERMKAAEEKGQPVDAVVK
jgi:hypothetical protein